MMRYKTLLFLTFAILAAAQYASADRICSPCSGPPSGKCVVDADTGAEVLQCAVDCKETYLLFKDAYCVYGDFECELYSGMQFSCKDQSHPVVRCDVFKDVSDPTKSDCVLECAKQCGSLTTLVGDCDECTSSDMCSFYPAGSPAMKACSETCRGVCESNAQLCSVIAVLRLGAMFLGVIMLILHGFKWMVSEDAEGRIDAKHGIMQIFAGFIVIIIASYLVEYILNETVLCPLLDVSVAGLF